jgi:hypothetical protein
MVHLVGNVGHLQEVENMAKEMWFVNHVAEWRALVGTFRIRCNVEMGEYIAQQILELEP